MSSDLENLSISEFKKIKKDDKQKLKKEYHNLIKKQKLIDDIKKIQKARKQINNPKPNPKPKPKPKTFDDYFEECIRNKTIPTDTPAYLRKALERTIREYTQGIEKEKSALKGFANKYVIEGKPGILPSEFLNSKSTYLKELLRNHPNIKVRFVLVCLMEKMEKLSKKSLTIQSKAYFQSDTHINLESSDVDKILFEVIKTILEKIEIYQQNGSGWYFKEVTSLEIHTDEYKPMKGGSYIPLPDWIMRKKAIVSIRNSDDKCFIWSVLRYLHPRKKNDSRLSDLKRYENELK